LDRNYDKIYEEEKMKKKQNNTYQAPTFKQFSKTDNFEKTQTTLQKKPSFKNLISQKNELNAIKLKSTQPVKSESTPTKETVSWGVNLKKSTDSSTPTTPVKETASWGVNLKKPESKNEFPKPSSNPFGKTVKDEPKSEKVEQKELHHLLKWVNGMLWCVDFKVENFTTSFRNGRAFCEIASQIDSSVKYDSQKSGEENIKTAWDLFEKMEIDTFLDAEDVGKEQKSMMLCIKMVRDYFRAHD
jgi:hypothetical protein